MNLEDQVCSLELAKKLKDLGVKQNSLFYWIKVPIENEKIVSCFGLTYVTNIFQEINKFEEIYSAFTASELGEMLPVYITIKENEPFNNFRINITKASLFETELKINYLVNYRCDTTEMSGEHAWLSRGLFEHNIYDTNFSNALAKTLIYLLENNLMKI